MNVLYWTTLFGAMPLMHIDSHSRTLVWAPVAPRMIVYRGAASTEMALAKLI